MNISSLRERLQNSLRACAFAIAATTVVSATDASAADPIVQNPPGLPLGSLPIIGGQTIVLSEGGGVGLQPVTFFGQTYKVLPGDVVILNDPLGGDAPSNFAAIVDFFNPADPTGTLALLATEYQTYFGGNVGPTTFADFKLASNTIFVPQSEEVTAPTPGEIVATYGVFGPQGAILAGQLAIFALFATPQPASPDPQPISGSAPEPAAWVMLLLGVGLAGGALRKSARKGDAQPECEA